MKLLFDECLPKKLRREFPEHQISTVSEMNWRGIKNGKLLALASEQFDAFVTADRNLGYQQNLERLPIAVVVLEASSNRLRALLPLVGNLKLMLGVLKPKTYVTVSG
jgi:predicted nuclease of predicted toxin-antitoxin system